jgi:flavin reductase (DIM6/NTAB) family NADH-FMN oxidoreductase RutF
MRHWATGVTIVSAIHNGFRHGMTASSFTSVSLTPPLVLVSLEQVTKTHQLVQHAGYFGVTILDQGQQEISDRFAGRLTEFTDRFEGLDVFTLVSGVPFLAQGLSWFDCKVVATYQAGNHTVFIGDVLAARMGEEDPPLIYYNRDYRRLINEVEG